MPCFQNAVLPPYSRRITFEGRCCGVRLRAIGGREAAPGRDVVGLHRLHPSPSPAASAATTTLPGDALSPSSEVARGWCAPSCRAAPLASLDVIPRPRRSTILTTPLPRPPPCLPHTQRQRAQHPTCGGFGPAPCLREGPTPPSDGRAGAAVASEARQWH